MEYALKKKEIYSYADYLGWNDGKQWQIIKGEPYCDMPAPTHSHQTFSGNLYRIISIFLLGKKCQIIYAPFDVILAEDYSENNKIFNVVQPDLSVFCDPKKIQNDAARGAPDWIIEVLSPSTAIFDWHKKFLLYQRFGVKEYWIVDPAEEKIYVHVLDNGTYKDYTEFKKGSKIKCSTLKGLVIDSKLVFSK